MDVLQGSIFGPLLFIVYIDDAVNVSCRLKYAIYDDDTNLLPGDEDLLSLHRTLTTELELINQWIQSNKLKLNIQN